MKIFVDSFRHPDERLYGFKFDLILRDHTEVMRTLGDLKASGGQISYLSVDYDLGLSGSGYDSVKRICEYDEWYGVLAYNFDWKVHGPEDSGNEHIMNHINNHMMKKEYH